MTTTPRLRKPRLFVQVAARSEKCPLQYINERGVWSWWDQYCGEWIRGTTMSPYQLAVILLTHVEVPL